MSSARTANASIRGRSMHPLVATDGFGLQTLAATGDLGLQKLAPAGDLEQHGG